MWLHLPLLMCIEIIRPHWNRSSYSHWLYEGRLKSQWADQDTPMECGQMRFIFQYSPSCSLHTTSIGVEMFGSNWSKVIHLRYDIITWTFQPKNLSSHIRLWSLIEINLIEKNYYIQKVDAKQMAVIVTIYLVASSIDSIHV